MNISVYPQIGEHSVSEQSARMSVLVVDEDAAVRDACCEIALKNGFLSHGVPGVAAARELLRGNSIDIILLDLKGPGRQVSNFWTRSRRCTRRRRSS